jgi:hypothetical protein
LTDKKRFFKKGEKPAFAVFFICGKMPTGTENARKLSKYQRIAIFFEKLKAVSKKGSLF